MRYTYLATIAAALLLGCASIPPISQVDGPSAEMEVVTSTLNARSIYPDEKVAFVVFRNSDNERLGGELLTIQHPRKIVRLPVATELHVRMLKSMALVGFAVFCVGEGTFILEAGKRYRATFDFDYQYSDPSLSTCVGAIDTLNDSGLPIHTQPLAISARRNDTPLFIPIPRQ